MVDNWLVVAGSGEEHFAEDAVTAFEHPEEVEVELEVEEEEEVEVEEEEEEAAVAAVDHRWNASMEADYPEEVFPSTAALIRTRRGVPSIRSDSVTYLH